MQRMRNRVRERSSAIGSPTHTFKMCRVSTRTHRQVVQSRMNRAGG